MNGETMVGFGYKQAWLAIADTTPDTVIGALGVRDLGPVSWRTGVDLAYLTDDRLVVTPALADGQGREWTLVTGRWLLRSTSRVDIDELSGELGTEVQFFATYRVTELHRWARAAYGVLLRAFGYIGESGELLEWRGDPDDAETALGLPTRVDDEDPGSGILVGEDDVLKLADRWSVNPSTLDGRPAPGPLRATATNGGPLLVGE